MPTFIDRLMDDVARTPTEGVTVLVVADTEAIARQAGPMVAMHLHPGRLFRDVLLIEGEPGRYHVTVRDLGPTRPR